MKKRSILILFMFFLFAFSSSFVLAIDEWNNYGRDYKNSFVSPGYIDGPLIDVWKYKPNSADLRMVNSFLADETAVYLRWSRITPKVNSNLEKIDLNKNRIWITQVGINFDRYSWLTMSDTAIFSNDDSFGCRIKDTGSSCRLGLGMDTWGPVIFDKNTNLTFKVNNLHLDGDGLHVQAFNLSNLNAYTAKWSALVYDSAAGTNLVADVLGGLVLSNGSLIYAPNYYIPSGTTNFPYHSGIYSFNPLTGAIKWKINTLPISVLSADENNIYLIENSSSSSLIIARKQSDGSIVWSKPVTSPGVQAPIVLNDRIIIGTTSEVQAYNKSNGFLIWRTPLLDAGVVFVSTPNNPLRSLFTTMAVANASQTLVVAGAKINILSLSDGSIRWSGKSNLTNFTLTNPIIIGKRIYFTDNVNPKYNQYNVMVDPNNSSKTIFLGGVVAMSAENILNNYHPADVNSDFRLNQSEATSYSLYFQGQLPFGSNGAVPSQNYSTRANLIFAFGENYKYNSSLSCPACWIAESSESTVFQISSTTTSSKDYVFVDSYQGEVNQSEEGNRYIDLYS